MKVLLVVFAAVLAAALPTDPEMEKQRMMEIRDKCASELQASEEDLKKLKDSDMDSDLAKKMALCFLRSLKIMSDDDKFSKNDFIAETKKRFEGSTDEADKLKALEEVADKCDAEDLSKASSAEDKAKIIVDCLKMNFEEKKIDGFFHKNV